MQSIFLVQTYGTRSIPKQRKENLWDQIESAFLKREDAGESKLEHD